ncbi:DUF1570 domain-containing protein [Pseudoalteromonas sp. SCSIO 43201]|uniref:DUF1570 domain-containing protein n=1 Tax=Pseudoalteromonas sp. SCSIO 43201 TaxID=2822842 RepID=UPI0020754DC2|nr:DUF1570 domain-containing protein [Pseudoalteromonas sp. SCSIO 43201]USD29261.1 DUF1570 domain-containing protein [Pseudoalteromonas sp. SCSIO 43201]
MIWRGLVALLLIIFLFFLLVLIYPSASKDSPKSLLQELGKQLEIQTNKLRAVIDPSHVPTYKPQLNTQRVTQPVTQRVPTKKPEQVLEHLTGHSDVVNMFSGMTTPTCATLKNKVFSLNAQSQNNQQLQLQLTGKKLNPQARAQAQQVLQVVYLLFQHFINQSAQKKALSPIQLNMYIAANDDEYNELLLARNVEPSGTAGMYFLFQNQGFVNGGGSDEQTLRTLLHESVHALVFYYFGLTPRWVTEGIAEYFEHLRINETGRFTIYNSTEDWLTQQGLLRTHYTKLDISTLFNSEDQWQTLQNTTLYANTYLFTGFMIENNSNALFEYLLQEGSNPCNIVPAQNIETLFRSHNAHIESQFEQWRSVPRRIQIGRW